MTIRLPSQLNRFSRSGRTQSMKVINRFLQVFRHIIVICEFILEKTCLLQIQMFSLDFL